MFHSIYTPLSSQDEMESARLSRAETSDEWTSSCDSLDLVLAEIESKPKKVKRKRKMTKQSRLQTFDGDSYEVILS